MSRDKGPISFVAADGEPGLVGSLHSVLTSVAVVLAVVVVGEIPGNCGAVFNLNTIGDEAFLERIPTPTPSIAPPIMEPAISKAAQRIVAYCLFLHTSSLTFWGKFQLQ